MFYRHPFNSLTCHEIRVTHPDQTMCSRISDHFCAFHNYHPRVYTPPSATALRGVYPRRHCVNPRQIFQFLTFRVYRGTRNDTIRACCSCLWFTVDEGHGWYEAPSGGNPVNIKMSQVERNSRSLHFSGYPIQMCRFGMKPARSPGCAERAWRSQNRCHTPPSPGWCSDNLTPINLAIMPPRHP